MAKTRASNQRGVVMVTVVLLLLVLTVLGMAAAIMMTGEDRSSSRSELAKEALYVAESGLRRGEVVLTNNVTYSNPTLRSLLTYTPVADCQATTPTKPTPPTGAGTWDVGHLGTYLRAGGLNGAELSNVDVTATFGLPGNRRALYSVYVRNNEADLAGPTDNTDAIIRLISVGWVATANGQPLVVKILEEEYNYGQQTMGISGQKQGDTGGTGSGLFG